MPRLAYLQQFSSKDTVSSYSWALGKFFTALGIQGATLEEKAEAYLSASRDYKSDLGVFLESIKEEPPKSIRMQTSVVKTFLLENERELPTLFWKRLSKRVKGSKALTRDKIPSTEELRSIITHMPESGRALFLTLASSGARIGEILLVEEQDLNLEDDPASILLRGETTKSGENRVIFVSKEARDAIQEWLKVRPRYLSQASKKYLEAQKGPEKGRVIVKSETDDRVFPFSTVNAYNVWRRALEKAGFKEVDDRTGRLRTHPHVLRKRFRTLFGSVNQDLAEFLMGHKSYLSDEYRRPSEEQVGKFYRDSVHLIEVFSNRGEVGKELVEVKSTLADVTIQNQAYASKTENDITELKQIVRAQNEELDRMRRDSAELQKQLLGYFLKGSPTQA